MSFEGYYRFLCSKGHLERHDVYSIEAAKCEEWDEGGCVMNWSKLKCSCGSPMVWRDLVDETNGEQDEYLNAHVLIETRSADMRTCEHCGKSHACTPATYEIPETFGHKMG